MKGRGAVATAGDLRWVTCSIREFGEAAGRHNHLIHKGGLTTLCGAGASSPDVWVPQRSTKAKCPTCLRLNNGGRVVTGARLAEPSAQSVYEEYFELRSMGIVHEAACVRTGLNPHTLTDALRQARERGMDLPQVPEGYKLTDDWNEPLYPGIREWLREGMED